MTEAQTANVEDVGGTTRAFSVAIMIADPTVGTIQLTAESEDAVRVAVQKYMQEQGYQEWRILNIEEQVVN